MQARQRGIMHQLDEQLASMRKRTACADGPVDASACSPLLAQPTLSPVPLQSSISTASATAVSEEQSQMRNMPFISALDRSAALEMQAEHSPRPALQRPRSVAQKAGMNVWSRHAARYRSAPLSHTACLLSHSSHRLCLSPCAPCEAHHSSRRSCWATCLSCFYCSLTSLALICGKWMLHCCLMSKISQAVAAAGKLRRLSRTGCPAGAAPSARHRAPARPARRTSP